MAQTNSKFYSLMVVGNNPKGIIEKYSSDYKSEPYVKYKYLDAKKYQKNAIKVIKAMLDNIDTVKINPSMKETLQIRLDSLMQLTPFEYYRELTDGMYYNEDGDALCEENPNAKYNTARIGRNFALPLKLKNGTEAYSALAKDVDWESMNGVNKSVYESAWDMVMNGKKPETKEEKTIYNAMKDKDVYFSKFKSKEAYVNYSTSYWNYAYADINGWSDIDDEGNEEKWINEFYPRFVENLNPNDMVTIFECSINNG